MVERVHLTFWNLLRVVVADSHNDLVVHLPSVLDVYRDTIHAMLGISSFEALFNHKLNEDYLLLNKKSVELQPYCKINRHSNITKPYNTKKTVQIKKPEFAFNCFINEKWTEDFNRFDSALIKYLEDSVSMEGKLLDPLPNYYQ
ncbi:hypothetical protein DERF_012409 [Dermatophagoides farinae]|uniref:Uncharacterized protein n=1 Tax=Dermatophagoides farinae TaxID=6954 RepID=A0A922HRT3_DERFA|nr:hypothetical protein DERF_012409 [Dermatophagoides farinae]